jgi:2-oxoacid:acceptor oxidoreductase delta subunit (pyruvate/2-ketoisovalerate family)
MVVLALGQDVDTSALDRIPDVEHDKDGVVKVGADMMTGHAGIFAGGDMVPSERTITVAAGHGKKAARNIDTFLQHPSPQPSPPKGRGGNLEPSPLKGKGSNLEPSPLQGRGQGEGRKPLATFEKLNTWYYSDAEKTIQPVLDLIRRQTTFGEVIGGLDETNALFEARRCMSCGNCFECDNCFAVCPDNAVIKLGTGKRFEFNYDYCKGCGVCVAECPCGAIEMVPEDI